MGQTVGGGAGSVLSQGAAAANGSNTPTIRETGTSIPNPSLQSLQPAAVTPDQFQGSTSTASTVGQAPTAVASTPGQAPTAQASQTGNAPTANAQMAGPIAGVQNGQINPNDATNAASQLDAITNANSPYIQQATQQGLLSAASRGLENSSLGAGAAEAAAVQAAAPLAEQNAQGATAGELQNSQLGTQASEFNAGQQNANQQLNAQLQTQTGQFNAGQQNANQQLASQLQTQTGQFNAGQQNANQQMNAQMQTQTGQFNAAQQQAAAQANAQMVNQINQQMQQIQGQLSTQFLSGSQAQQLANIQGQYSQLISQNQSAAALTQAAMSAMSAALSNPQVSKDQATYAINAETNMLQTSLGIINVINGGGGASGIPTGGLPNPLAATPNPGGAISPGGSQRIGKL